MAQPDADETLRRDVPWHGGAVTTSDLQPTVDAFHALARSSPWRWRTLHFRHREGREEVEAWLRRPGRLTVRTADGRLHRVTDEPTSAMASSVVFWSVSEPGRDLAPPEVLAPAAATYPDFRSDGLVADRGDDFAQHDDPMWVNYSWVAMLDPVELSHHVDVRNLRADLVAGRPAWRADLRALPGYEPRCGSNCCELLWSEASWYADFRGGEDPDPDAPPIPEGTVFPDDYDVALDVQTGVVVRCLPVGGGNHGYRPMEIDIIEVDADLDEPFS